MSLINHNHNYPGWKLRFSKGISPLGASITSGVQKKQAATTDVIIFCYKLFVHFTPRRQDSSSYGPTTETLDLVHHERNEWWHYDDYAVVLAELRIKHKGQYFVAQRFSKTSWQPHKYVFYLIETLNTRCLLSLQDDRRASDLFECVRNRVIHSKSWTARSRTRVQCVLTSASASDL